MKILIAGIGTVGVTLVRNLSAEGHDLTLIDRRGDVLEAVAERYDVMAVRGNCAAMDVLRQAGVEEADLLIAATDADEVNLLCCTTAHGLNPRLHTIARICTPDYTAQIYGMPEVFALSLAVNPEEDAAAEIERLLKYPGFLKRDTFADGRVEIVEIRVTADSKLRNVSLSDMYGIVKCRVLVCTVLRGGRAFTPGGDFVLKEGDRVFVTAPTNNLTTLLKNVGLLSHKVRRVMLVGGGEVGFYLAKRLQKSGIEVRLIEKDRERCVELAADLPEVCIIHGDASSQPLLESEGLSKCDALVSLTDTDELNMVLSLYANGCGVSQVITLLKQTDNPHLLNALPIGSVICPREFCSNSILRYVRAMQHQNGAALTVHTIADGQAEAMEFAVDDTTLHCDEPLKTLKLKKGVLVVGISHGERTEIPGGDSLFRQGDTVVVVSSDDTAIRQLNDIFE